jgi:hypothetical protein
MKELVFSAYSALHNEGREISKSGEIFHGSQYSEEFFRAWDSIHNHISKLDKKEITFLEVGAYRGVWGIAFGIYCNLVGKRGHYVSVTDLSHDVNNTHLLKSIKYIHSLGHNVALINKNTYDDSVVSDVTSIKESFDIVFIDAGHLYDDVVNDTQKFAPLADEILMYHDIRPKVPVKEGLVHVWPALQDLGIELDEEIITDEKRMGIGLKYKNNA